MTGVVSATSATLTTILEGVQTTAATATKAISTASQSLDMLELYVRKAKLDQSDAHVIHRKTSRLYALEAAARERTRHQKALATEMYADPQTKALFDANFAELSALFD